MSSVAKIGAWRGAWKGAADLMNILIVPDFPELRSSWRSGRTYGTNTAILDDGDAGNHRAKNPGRSQSFLPFTRVGPLKPEGWRMGKSG